MMSLLAAAASAIVIRHDVADKHYQAVPADFPPLATLYRIGADGTLIEEITRPPIVKK